MTYPYNSVQISISYAPTCISMLCGTSLKNMGSYDAFTPQQTIELVSRIGCKKSHRGLHKLCCNSSMASLLLESGAENDR